MLNMKQTTSNQSSSSSVAPPQPVSVSGSNRKNNLSTTAASFNQSAHSSGDGDGNNSHLLDTYSNNNNYNYTPITGADVLVGRILEFQRPFPSLLPAASAAADNDDDDDGKGMKRPATIRAGQPPPPPPRQQRRRRPPPPPPRSGSLKKKHGKAKNPSATNSPTSSSETTSCTTNSCYENEKEQEHVVRRFRLARMKLDGRDSSTPRDSILIGNPPPLPPPPPPPPRTHSVDRQRHLGDRGERHRRSRARSGDRDDDLHSSFHSSFSKSLEQPRFLRRSESVEQQQRHLNDRQRRSRERGGDRDDGLNASFSSSNGSSRERPANAHVYPPPPLRQHHRSRSREARRLPEKEKSINSDTEVRRKKNLGSNSFVRQDGELNFDTKTGRCKKHPSIILAKKSKFRSGSWEVIKKNGCPFCAKVLLEEDCDRDGCEQSLDEDTKRKMNMLLKVDQDMSGDTSSPQWSRNGESRKSFSSRGSSGNYASLDQNVIDSIPEEGLRGNKVQRMLYTTPMGETGWYTGEVDLERKPHGHGRMRYKTGHSYEGEWIHGYGEVHMENLNRMKAGFGTNKAAWKKSEMAPSVRKATIPDASKSSSSPSTRHHYQHQQQQSSNNQGYLSAQMQQQAHLQQVQMQHAQLQQVQMQQQQAQLHQAQMQQWASMSPHERQMVMNQWYASVGMPSQPGGFIRCRGIGASVGMTSQPGGYPPM